MYIRRSAHAVYDRRSHPVWCPKHQNAKYRKAILQGAPAARLRALFHEIGYAYDIAIEEREVSVDRVRLPCAFPPRLSIVQAVTRLKT